MSSQDSGWKNVTSGVGAGVKGAYAELIAATTFASTWMSMQVYCDITNSDSVFDLATGLGGSEVIVVDDQLYHFRNDSGGTGRGNTLSFPMTIPLGTRLSVRVQDGEAGAVLHQHTLTISNFVPPVAVSLTSDSSGKKIITSGGIGGAFGSWVELIPSTTTQRGWIVVSLFTIVGLRKAEFDIGIGSAGNEVPIMNALAFQKSTSGNDGVCHSTYVYFPVNIVAGTRVSIRVKDDNVAMVNYTTGAFLT